MDNSSNAFGLHRKVKSRKRDEYREGRSGTDLGGGLIRANNNCVIAKMIDILINNPVKFPHNNPIKPKNMLFSPKA
jgi:hypothetical protein